MKEQPSEPVPATRRRPGAERLLKVASELFYQKGIRAVGVDTVSEQADVSKRTLYNRFGDKDGLVVEYLRSRDERWWAYLEQLTEEMPTPQKKLLAIFKAYENWQEEGGFRGCPFANAAAEIADPEHPARITAQQHKARVKEYLTALAQEAKFDLPEALAERLLLLLEGATVTAAMRGNGKPFETARSAAAELLASKGHYC